MNENIKILDIFSFENTIGFVNYIKDKNFAQNSLCFQTRTHEKGDSIAINHKSTFIK